MRKIKHKAEPVILFAIFVFYLIVLFKITIFRASDAGARSVNLIPFATIEEYLRSILTGNMIIGASNLFGNVVMFLPLGYLTALLFPKMRRLTGILALSAALSMVIEVFQYILACGATDIDDVILNTLGGIAGFWVYILTSRAFKPKKFAIFISASMIVVTVIGFFAFNSYKFLLPMAGNLPAQAERRNRNLGEAFVIDVQPDARLPAGADSAAELLSDDEAAWHLILVNKWNYAPDNYEVELTKLSNGQAVDKRIYPALEEMLDAARNDGVYAVVVSGHRTAENQQSLMNDKIAEYEADGRSAREAVIQAEAWVAVPGTSEHQLGIAVDINADGINSTGYEVYEWLDQNAFKFGFICRYPSDKTEITGVINEPWHYRYVGVAAATEMHNQGICLEEYLGETNGPP